MIPLLLLPALLTQMVVVCPFSVIVSCWSVVQAPGGDGGGAGEGGAGGGGGGDGAGGDGDGGDGGAGGVPPFHMHLKPAPLCSQQQRQKHSDPSSLPPHILPPCVQLQSQCELLPGQALSPALAAAVPAMVPAAVPASSNAAPASTRMEVMGIEPGEIPPGPHRTRRGDDRLIDARQGTGWCSSTAPRDRILQHWIVLFRFTSKFSTCVSAVQYSNVGQ